MTAPLFRLRVSVNGQTDAQTDTTAIYELLRPHFGTGEKNLIYTNDGFDLVNLSTEPATVAEIIRAAFPDVTVRVLKRGVRVLRPREIEEAVRFMGIDWQIQAARGDAHRAMYLAAINHPTIADFAARGRVVGRVA